MVISGHISVTGQGLRDHPIFPFRQLSRREAYGDNRQRCGGTDVVLIPTA